MEDVVIPSSPEDRKKIKNALQEISDSMTRMASERDLIKDIKKMLHDDYELPRKYVSKMAKVYHAQSFDAEVAEADNFATLYETITGQKPNEDEAV